MGVRTSWNRAASGALVAAVVGSGLTLASPAYAAIGSPVIVGPTGQSSSSPELTWERVNGATGYEVQLDHDADFSTPEWAATTVNSMSVPTKVLAPGDASWRVRAKDGSGTWGDWSVASLTVEKVTAPVPTSPAYAADLQQPADPPLLQWEGVHGATSYTVEVDTENEFVSPDTYTTRATSLVVPVNQAPDVDYFWRVKATLADGVVSDYSATFQYHVLPIATPEITGPPDDQDISDVVLDWDKVDGARWYELQVDDDFDFSSPDTDQVPSKIYGTRFSPATTFANDQYYWRVRAVDLSGHPTDWVHLDEDSFFHFDRVWEDTPQAVYPMGSSTQFVGDDLYYQWTPVRHASTYQVWLSTDENFTYPSPETKVCTVVGTTYTPGELGDECMPRTEGRVYYWKVRPMDLPFGSAGVPGIFSARQQFVYDDQEWINLTGPRTSPAVDIPTLSWEPVPSTEKYDVELLDNTGGTVFGKETYANSVTPFGIDALDPADGPFTWWIKAIDADDRVTTRVSRRFQVSGTVTSTGTPLTPITGRDGDPATYRAPDLRWQPVDGADHYVLYVRDNASGNLIAATSKNVIGKGLPYPAVTDISDTFLATGSYDWWVTAQDASGVTIANGYNLGRVGTFRIAPLPPVQGQRLALTGSALSADNACTRTLEDGPDQMCTGLPATPVLDWSPVQSASVYRVHISKDANFTTGSLDDTPPFTTNSRWTPNAKYPQPALQDSTAQTAYYWFIQPCKSPTKCGPDPRSSLDPADHAFKKTSPKVGLLTPANDNPATEADDATGTEITFTWEDYFDRNQATTYDATGETSPQSGMQYQFQIDDQPTFASPFESGVLVDQPTYTSPDELYPEGPLYWRVQPIDGAGNALGWSETRTVVKRSERPTLVSPISSSPADTFPGTVPFRWNAQPFAGKYEIQVAKDGDANFSTTNLVLTTRATAQAAYTTGMGSIKTLPASTMPYVWHVRRVDPLGNAGPWSTPESFYSFGEAPLQLAPTTDTLVGPQAGLFRWTAVDGAVKYRVEYRRTGGSTIQMVTPALSFAPTGSLTAGGYQWRISSIDVEGATMGVSGWRDFTVATSPTATTAPTISGPGTFGTILTSTAPVWNVGGVTDTYQWLRDGQPIPTATGSSYEVTATDVGLALSLRVTGTASGFDASITTSNTVTSLAAAAPTATVSASIAGSGKVGTVLTSTLPSWNPSSGVVSSRQWLRNGSPVSGAVDPTFTVRPGDVGATVTLRVTGSMPGHADGSSTSNGVVGATGDAPTATTAPNVTGSGKVGTSLEASPPTWSLSGVSDTLQWLRDGQPISGATGTTYDVVAGDVSRSLAVRYTGTASGRATATAVSSPVVASLGDAPTASTPQLTGSGKVGSTLTVPSTSWNLAGVTETLQWFRGTTPITGETSRSHVVSAADLGNGLSVRIAGAVPGRRQGTVTSSSVLATVGDAPVATRAPAVAGTTSVGRVLTADPGAWTGAPAFTFSWLRNGIVIPGATGTTYQVVGPDAGQRIAVRVTASTPGRAAGVGTSPTVAIYRIVPTVKVGPRTQKVRLHRRATIKVTVVAPGLPGPTGTIRIYDGARLVKTLTLRADQLGVVRTKVEMAKAGKRTLKVKYSGSTAVMPKSGTATVSVVR